MHVSCRPQAALFALLAAIAGGLGGCGGGPVRPVIRAGRVGSPVPPSVAPGPQRPVAGGLPGVDNFGVVTPSVWRGAKPTREGMASLAALDVGTIVDLQEADESMDVPPGVRYVRLPVPAWEADRVDTAAVLAAVRVGPGPVFIHCREGAGPHRPSGRRLPAVVRMVGCRRLGRARELPRQLLVARPDREPHPPVG